MGASGSVPDRDTRVDVAVEHLLRRADFRAAASGLRAAAGAFVLQARRRADSEAIRVGFTVSKQVGNAVERNRVRRRLREIVRLTAAGAAGAVARADGVRSGSALRPGHDYVLIGRRAALAAPFSAMLSDLGAALSRIHAADAGGTGAARRGPLHEAGSPPAAPAPGRSRKPRDHTAHRRESAE
jgi:ribonuclease P protein component